MRREIETAIENKRNIIPLMMEGFDFGSTATVKALTGKLADLKKYNALGIPTEYFDEAMIKLRSDRFLNRPLESISHPVSETTKQITEEQKFSASEAAPIEKEQLTAEEWFERGNVFVESNNFDEAIRCYTEAIRLQPNQPDMYYNRGTVYGRYQRKMQDAINDFDEAIRLRPNFFTAIDNRGIARRNMGDLDGALEDHNEAIRIKPDYANAFNNRGIVHNVRGDLESAIRDYTRSIELKIPNLHLPYYNRGNIHLQKGELEDAIKEYDEAIRIKADYADAYYIRAKTWEKKKDYSSAIADYQKYLELVDTKTDQLKELTGKIKKLKSELTKKKPLKNKAK